MRKPLESLQIVAIFALVLLFLASPAVSTDAVLAHPLEHPITSPPTRHLDALDGSGGVGPELTIYTADNTKQVPDVAYNWRHNEYLVVWHNVWAGGSRDIYARRVSGTGQILSWFSIASGGVDRAQPSVAYDPDLDRYLVVWVKDVFGNNSDWDVFGRFIPWNGPDAGLGEFPICSWPSNQWTPKVTYNEHASWPEFMVTWTNTPVATPAYVSARRVFADGSGFPPGDGFTVAADAAYVLNYVSPDIAYNLARNEYLVVFGKNDVDIFGQRLAANGTLLGGMFGVAGWSDTEQHAAIAAINTANQYFVVWQSYVGGTQWEIYGRPITGLGVPGAVNHIAARAGAHNKEPDIAANARAGHYLVTWQEQYSNTSGPYGITARLLYADGSMGAETGLVGPYPGTDRLAPAVAAGRPGYLVAWEHERYNTTYVDIHGKLFWPAVIYVPLVLR